MIVGAKYWNARDRYYKQDNNPTEHLLRLRLPGGKGWLETCGPTAAVNCLAALGATLEMKAPGGYTMQPEQVLADYLNDPANFAKLKAAYSAVDPEHVPGNEVAEWYPAAVAEVFGRKCSFAGRIIYEDVLTHLRSGNPVQACLINPGHFVAIVAFDDANGDLVINDPWAGRWPDGTGFSQRLTRTEFERNTKPKCIVYW